MKTIVFQYNNNQMLVLTANGDTTLKDAENVARENMPADADKFRVVSSNRVKSAWRR